MHPYIIPAFVRDKCVSSTPHKLKWKRFVIWIEAKQFKNPSVVPCSNYVTVIHVCVVPSLKENPVLNWLGFFYLSVVQIFQAGIFKYVTLDVPIVDFFRSRGLCNSFYICSGGGVGEGVKEQTSKQVCGVSRWGLNNQIKNTEWKRKTFFQNYGTGAWVTAGCVTIYVLLCRDGGSSASKQWKHHSRSTCCPAFFCWLNADTSPKEEFPQGKQKIWACP